MKKLITFAMMLVLVMTLVGCSMLPESVQASINNIFGGEQPDVEQTPTDDQPHTHDFVLVDSAEATCTEDGYNKYECSCGEKKEESFPATGHDIQKYDEKKATCTVNGMEYYACTKCGGEKKGQLIKAYGHDYSVVIEPSRFASCSREGCSDSRPAFGSSGRYTESLTFNFTSEHEQALTDKFAELNALLAAAPKYDPALHGYSETGELAESYAEIDAIHTELYDMVLYAVAQRQIAEIDYYCKMNDTDLEARYSYMLDYYTSLISEFYALSQPFYDSCYREFYYYGMSEEEVNAYLFDSNALSNPEYTALKERNNEIEVIFLAIEDPTKDPQVPVLYAEFVANNNKMAQLMGYDNYLEYAYENVYGRDYSYQDVDVVLDHVATYLVGPFNDIYIEYLGLMGNASAYSQQDINDYYSQVMNSFFVDSKSNKTLNDYIDTMSFTTNPDKLFTFSDILNDLCSDGNLYRGKYEGAFVTSLSAFDIPIAYFGTGYDTPFTVAHEFGHYVNEVYNGDEYSMSYDLLEIHSQGNEMLYLSFLEGHVTNNAYTLTETYQILSNLNIIMAALSVDSFERAVYTGYYEGAYADVIMADGVITYDEYDLLYEGVLENMGVSGRLSHDYWRYMTITSPCYYVSYAMSALCSIQIYQIAETDGLDVAADSYLKLITYTDVDPDMSMEEVLEYAGFYSYMDEALYRDLARYFANR